MRPGLGLPQTPPRRAAADGFEQEERLAMEGRSPLQMDRFKMALCGLQEMSPGQAMGYCTGIRIKK
jgi:hypothetical protein